MAKKKDIKQVLLETNTDDDTVSQFLEDSSNPAYKPPYSKKFIKKHNLKNKTAKK